MTCSRCRGLLRRDEDGLLVCRICGHLAGPRPPLPLAVPVVKRFKDTPPTRTHSPTERQRRILAALVAHPDESQYTIAFRLGMSRSLIGYVAKRYGVGRRDARTKPPSAAQREQIAQMKRVHTTKARGRTHVA